MTKTYMESEQAILFSASRQLRQLAAGILDDVQDRFEITGQTAAWAKGKAAAVAVKANELEQRGHDLTYASGHAVAANNRARLTYSKAIDRFEARLRAHGVDPLKLAIAEASTTR